MLGYPDSYITESKLRLGGNPSDLRQSYESIAKPYVNIEIDVCFCCYCWYLCTLNYCCSQLIF